MFAETEIKLQMAPGQVETIKQHPLISSRLRGKWRSRTLRNGYVDTPDLQLDHAGIALRLRQDGSHYIQTLKTRGVSVGGLSVRAEWDRYLPGPQLQLVPEEGEEWPEVMSSLDTTVLETVFHTDFCREKADLIWFEGEAEMQAEIAIDRGEVRLADGRVVEEIREVELELRRGDADALVVLAAELVAQLPLFPGDISKGERGFRHLRAELPLPALTWSDDTPIGEVARLALEQQLKVLSRQQALLSHDSVPEHLSTLLACLERLGELCSLLEASRLLTLPDDQSFQLWAAKLGAKLGHVPTAELINEVLFTCPQRTLQLTLLTRLDNYSDLSKQPYGPWRDYQLENGRNPFVLDALNQTQAASA